MNKIHARHNAINESRALQRAEVPSMKEPAGLSRSDEKRPDGLTLIPCWEMCTLGCLL